MAKTHKAEYLRSKINQVYYYLVLLQLYIEQTPMKLVSNYKQSFSLFISMIDRSCSLLLTTFSGVLNLDIVL